MSKHALLIVVDAAAVEIFLDSFPLLHHPPSSLGGGCGGFHDGSTKARKEWRFESGTPNSASKKTKESSPIIAVPRLSGGRHGKASG
ncbi:hypothetical protein NL676_002299 [Syzygium grande]|nr:hypothetical protein NL676_002299 [Syzygium grande]